MSPHLLLRMQSDERLVALVRDGHDQAFATAVDRYQPELLRYCTRLVGESRAEDVVQQAFLNAHMALRSSDQEIQLRPWLYRIAHNAGLNVLRATRQQAELDDRLAAPRGIEQDLESRERLREALAAIALLPEPQRDALTLQAVEGRSHTEIAAAIGVTPGAARQHLHSARATVRAAVSAITPYGLIARLAMAGTDGGGMPIAVTAGGATVAKVGAGLLAAGAIGVGATQLPVLHNRHPVRHAARVAPPAERAQAPAPAADQPAEHAVRGRSIFELHRGGRHHGRGAHDGSSHASHHHSGSEGEPQVERHSSGGEDGGHSGSSGSSGSSSGSDGRGGSSGGDGGSSGTSGSGTTSGSSSGDSGSSSGSGSGSDGSSGSSDGGTQVVTTATTAPTTTSGDDGSSGGSDGGSGGSDGGTSSTSGTSGSDDGH
jgi:RNA polymerase sigma factor (sigma-70 family)